jgi:alpha-D-ribose 1-methylphosphonate 5-phosphate C-P lyase
MDLILLVLVLAIVGWAVWLITTKIPMPPGWATGLQILALLILVLFLLQRLGTRLPNLLN